MSKSNTVKSNKFKKVEITFLVIASLLALVLMYELSPLSGNLRFYAKGVYYGVLSVESRTSFDWRGKYYSHDEGGFYN